VSTRSVIARPILESWEGRYCHYDGYPAHQGRVLHEAVTGHFAGDVEAARHYLIDQHPTGWSFLGGDFTKPAGFMEAPGRFDEGRNQCYCHGDRDDPPAPLITEGAAAEFADYGYVLGDDRLTVLVSRGGARLERGAEVAWSDQPDWDDLGQRPCSASRATPSSAPSRVGCATAPATPCCASAGTT
jgi:hypothetical protein